MSMRWCAVLLAALMPAAAFAWTTPTLANVVNSAPLAGRTVHVHADCSDRPGGPVNPVTARLFYSTDNQSSWNEVPMALLAVPGYDSTFACSFTAPQSGVVRYYVRADNGTNYGTQSPDNSGNTWPPGTNLLAEAANEPVGDTCNGARGPWLDLTGVRLGWSSNRFYCRLTNNHSSWPLSGGILGPWYIYSVALRNPDAPSDSFVFVMSYANAMGIYTSGLYEVNLHDPESYTRIGDIDTHTSGNVLSMRCALADLLARPRFGSWPNQSGFLYSDATTESATITRDHYSHDSTNHCRWYAGRTPRLVVDHNTAPLLARARVSPGQGTPETDFWFQIQYSDADSNLPLVRALVIDGDSFDLVPNHHQYWSGVRFDTTLSGFGGGWHRFRFGFSDGGSVVSSDPDSFLVTVTGLAGQEQLPVEARSLPTVARASDLVRFEGRVLDATGRKIRFSSSDFALRTSALPPGVYFLKSERRTPDAEPLTRKVILTR